MIEFLNVDSNIMYLKVSTGTKISTFWEKTVGMRLWIMKDLQSENCSQCVYLILFLSSLPYISTGESSSSEDGSLATT